MTLDEAIKHAEEVAEKNERRAESVRNRPISSADFYHEEESCSKCAEEHRQLAEWLKELKTSRECIERIRIACLCPGLREDGFEDEIVNAMNEYLYDMGKEW